jgi:hypothetical protein
MRSSGAAPLAVHGTLPSLPHDYRFLGTLDYREAQAVRTAQPWDFSHDSPPQAGCSRSPGTPEGQAVRTAQLWDFSHDSPPQAGSLPGCSLSPSPRAACHPVTLDWCGGQAVRVAQLWAFSHDSPPQIGLLCFSSCLDSLLAFGDFLTCHWARFEFPSCLLSSFRFSPCLLPPHTCWWISLNLVEFCSCDVL